jgi:SNF2 family DNA or RNA helicase
MNRTVSVWVLTRAPLTWPTTNRLVFNGQETEEPPVKAVVFSQWTFMLDLIEKALKARGWG